MSEENEDKLIKEMVRLREFMQSEISGTSLILEKVEALGEKVDLKFKALEDLRTVMEANRDKRCELHERDITELKKDKDELQKQRWTTAGVVAVIMFILTIIAPKIIEALAR